MAARYLLEPEYQQIEAKPGLHLSLRVVGRLLDAAIAGAPPNPSIERLLRKLEGDEGLEPLLIEPDKPSPVLEQVARYRDTAQVCRMQAWITTAKPTAEALLGMAADHERRADELEEQLTTSPRTARGIGRCAAVLTA